MSMLKQKPKKYDDGMTQQSFSNECDINEIMERSKNTGIQLAGNQKEPLFLDTTEIPDYRASLNIVLEAEAAFMSLDPKIRDRFDNDPGKMLEFVEALKDKTGYEEAAKLGLVDYKTVKEKFPDNSDGVATPPQQA